jgi:hypothetical protein
MNVNKVEQTYINTAKAEKPPKTKKTKKNKKNKKNKKTKKTNFFSRISNLI